MGCHPYRESVHNSPVVHNHNDRVRQILQTVYVYGNSTYTAKKGYINGRNINKYSFEDRVKISVALTNAYNKAKEASVLELIKKDQKAAINKWREVLGPSFPQYTD